MKGRDMSILLDKSLYRDFPQGRIQITLFLPLPLLSVTNSCNHEVGILALCITTCSSSRASHYDVHYFRPDIHCAVRSGRQWMSNWLHLFADHGLRWALHSHPNDKPAITDVRDRLRGSLPAGVDVHSNHVVWTSRFLRRRLHCQTHLNISHALHCWRLFAMSCWSYLHSCRRKWRLHCYPDTPVHGAMCAWWSRLPHGLDVHADNDLRRTLSPDGSSSNSDTMHSPWPEPLPE